MTPHLNRLVETVQMRGHNIWFRAELTKIIPNYRLIFPLIKKSALVKSSESLLVKMSAYIKGSYQMVQILSHSKLKLYDVTDKL